MICLQNVRAGYGGQEILHNISFSLSQGESLCIIGPNGCGKTTLLRTLAGTLPFSGEISLEGRDLRSIRPKALAKKVSMLSQLSQLDFNYTVMELVLMGRYTHGSSGLLGGISAEDQLAAEAALGQLDLLSLKNREANTLSGGQLQRVFLAKLLAQDPDLILLDEPTNHLDLRYQVELITFLKRWSKTQGKALIGVLHDLNLALLLSDRLLLLEEGCVRALDETRKVLTSPALSAVYQMDVGAHMRETLKQWEAILP